MKFLFLDVDGVLNDKATLASHPSPWLIKEECILNLKKIVDKTKCKIILTSTWRGYVEGKKKLKEHFEKHGIPLWISQTKDLLNQDKVERPRKEEISQWILDNQVERTDKIAILDDDVEACVTEDWFFKTYMNFGLTEDIAQKIIQFLGEE